MSPMRQVGHPRLAAGLILVIAAATVGTALAFEHAWGYRPCKLCLLQRWPYYVALPLALATVLASGRRALSQVGLSLLALTFLVSAGLGTYHAGVEWGWWLGPSDCSGAAAAPAPGVGDFLRSLETVRVVSCTEAAWRLFGLSMAGWNALISLGLAALAGFAALAPDSGRRRS